MPWVALITMAELLHIKPIQIFKFDFLFMKHSRSFITEGSRKKNTEGEKQTFTS